MAFKWLIQQFLFPNGTFIWHTSDLESPYYFSWIPVVSRILWVLDFLWDNKHGLTTKLMHHALVSDCSSHQWSLFAQFWFWLFILQVHSDEHCMTLEQSRGERAALVKGSQGDWAIVKARWDEFRRGIPPLKPGMIRRILTEILTGQAKIAVKWKVSIFSQK